MTSGLLVASPQMVDPFFGKTVVLLCDYDEDGAFGIVINRLTGLDTDNVLTQMEVTDGGGLSGPVHWGGPVQPGAVFLIFAPTEAGPNAEEEGVFSVAEGVTFSRSKDVIQTVAAEAQTRGFLTLGYAGWAAGQLDGEIETGSWIYLEADSDIVFDTPPEELWQRCIDSLGVDPAMIWMQPVSE